MRNFFALFIAQILAFHCKGQESTDLDAKLRSRRVAGGIPAYSDDLPYMVSIKSANSREAFCSGTILNERIVLTAAHCTMGYLETPICVSLGEPHQTSQRTTCNDVIKVEVHPDYYLPNELSDAINDIALIKLAENLPVGKTCRHVNLTRSGKYSQVGRVVTAFGWGAVREPKRIDLIEEEDDVLASDIFRYDDGTEKYARVFPKQLQKVNLVILSHEECEKKYEEVVHQSHFCAYAEGKGSCFKDSGGPLMSGRFQVGIFSGGKRCGANPGFPGLYTNVTMFLDWIELKTRRLYGKRNKLMNPNNNGSDFRIVTIRRWTVDRRPEQFSNWTLIR